MNEFFPNAKRQKYAFLSTFLPLINPTLLLRSFQRIGANLLGRDGKHRKRPQNRKGGKEVHACVSGTGKIFEETDKIGSKKSA